MNISFSSGSKAPDCSEVTLRFTPSNWFERLLHRKPIYKQYYKQQGPVWRDADTDKPVNDKMRNMLNDCLRF